MRKRDPHAARRRLRSQVMQELVEHFAETPARVEQCVLHMDIANLDFNQEAKGSVVPTREFQSVKHAPRLTTITPIERFQISDDGGFLEIRNYGEIVELVSTLFHSRGPGALEQVARLCKQRQLYSALIHIFNKGLDDFITPVIELMDAESTLPAAAPALHNTTSRDNGNVFRRVAESQHVRVRPVNTLSFYSTSHM
eukprot:1195505-Prorocentrum_minimum.AAC.4